MLVYKELNSGLVFLDFEKWSHEFEPVGRVFVAGKRITDTLAVSGGVVALLLIGYLVIYRKKLRIVLKAKNEPHPDDIDLLIEKLSRNSGKTLQVDELDMIFEILHFPNPDYKRVRRSKLIGDINLRFKALNGNELIGRRRNRSDKRIMEYPIS